MEESEALRIFGVPLISATEENAQELLLTLVFIAAALLIARALQALATLAGGSSNPRAVFWSRQAVNILTAAVLLLGVLSTGSTTRRGSPRRWAS